MQQLMHTDPASFNHVLSEHRETRKTPLNDPDLNNKIQMVPEEPDTTSTISELMNETLTGKVSGFSLLLVFMHTLLACRRLNKAL